MGVEPNQRRRSSCEKSGDHGDGPARSPAEVRYLFEASQTFGRNFHRVLARPKVLRKAGEHAKEHGIRDVTPQLIERIKASIHDA
jgi:predicted small metal-binding protein